MPSLKQNIVSKIIEQLEADYALLANSALEAREAATHEESKAEDKYDTRGLEASYLAGAQAKRAAEIQQLVHVYQTMPLKDFSHTDGIAITALVELESLNKATLFFIVPRGGGVSVNMDGKTIQIISPISLVGEGLMGRNVDDEFEIEIHGKPRAYRILSLA